MATTRPDRLHFTGNDEADELIAREPLALLIGFVLDQQVPVQKAFSSPLELKRRFGSLDAAKIAGADPAELDAVFRDKRFGVKPPGWDEVAPKHRTLGDVDSPEALERYQEAKRAYKAKLRAQSA